MTVLAGIHIRDARAADVDALRYLEERAFAADRFSRRALHHLVTRARAVALVAAEDDPAGKLLGYAVLLHRSGSRVGRLYTIAVDPGARGSGLGARLLEAAEARARALGLTRMHLEVREDNADAIRLYRAAGYETIGLLEDYYEGGETALRMAREL